jgi:hypothetical protein
VQFEVAALGGGRWNQRDSRDRHRCDQKSVCEVVGVRFEVVGEVNHLGFKIPQSACIDTTDPGPELRPLSMIMHLR